MKIVVETFECAICKNIISSPVMICKACKTIVGCGECISRWYSGDEALEKGCPKCRVMRGYAEAMELKGISDLLEKVKKIDGEQNEERDDLNDTASLEYGDE